MQILKPILLATAALFAAQAHAGFVYSASAVPAGTYTAASFTDGVKASVQTGSVSNVYLQPKGTTGSYLVVSSQGGDPGQATINTKGVSSYSFVWGSPDTFNYVDIFSSATSFVEYSGSMLGTLAGFTPSGNNNDTKLFTITGTAGTTIDHLVLKSSGVAFETAVAAVPEPETYALMLAGLGALGFVARRRNRD